MAKRPIKPSDPVVPLEITTSQNDAEARINDRIEKGEGIFNKEIRNANEFEAVKREYSKWSDFNKELLKRLFTNDSLSIEYSKFSGAMSIGFGRVPSLGEEISDFKDNIKEKIHRLESIKERLEIIPTANGVQNFTTVETKKISTNKAFIVHGHDEGARESAARFLDKLGIMPVILHEQASGGRTVIEKLEHNADVDFAVVLLTPDDVGNIKTDSGNLNPRARQNVILELGYFVGKLGRNRVCALYKGSVELPSDFVGVVFVDMDNAGAWRFHLAKELREAGFNVDLNKAL